MHTQPEKDQWLPESFKVRGIRIYLSLKVIRRVLFTHHLFMHSITGDEASSGSDYHVLTPGQLGVSCLIGIRLVCVAANHYRNKLSFIGLGETFLDGK